MMLQCHNLISTLAVATNSIFKVILYCRYFIENEEERPLHFSIGVNNGIIRTTQPLDREEIAWHNITVMAAEAGKFPGSDDMICHVMYQ